MTRRRRFTASCLAGTSCSARSGGTGGYSIADIANQPYYLIAVGVMVLALLLSLVMIRIEKELPKEMRPK